MGMREPGALTKAIEQMRIDVADSDPEIRTTHVDFDSLLVVLEVAREAARQELVVEWLEFFRSTDHRTANETAVDLLAAIASIEAPFEHGMPPNADGICGEPSWPEGGDIVHCEIATGHDGNHQSGNTIWWPRCEATSPDGLHACGSHVDHDGQHSSEYADGKGLSW